MWRRWGGEVRERVMLVAFSEGGRKNSLPTLAFLPARAARSAGAVGRQAAERCTLGPG